ncbi:MAG: hypothetical protein RLY71_470 [Pseudomonadota bacterium]|jgi:predicted DNA-binding transcriptional regulator AlpA
MKDTAAHKAAAKQAAALQEIELQVKSAAADGLTLLKIEAVSAMTGLGRTTLFERTRAGTFSAPVRLGTRCTRWRAADVQAWLKAQQPGELASPAGQAESRPAKPAKAARASQGATRRKKAAGGAATPAAAASA